MKDPLKAGMLLFILTPYVYVSLRYLTRWLPPFGYLSFDVLLVGFVCLVLLVSYYINYCLDEPLLSSRLAWGTGSASGTLLFFVYWSFLVDQGSRYRFIWFMETDLSEAAAVCERKKGIRLLCQSGGQVTYLNQPIQTSGRLTVLQKNQVQLPSAAVLRSERVDPVQLQTLVLIMKRQNISSLRINREGVIEVIAADFEHYCYVPEGASREYGQYYPVCGRWYQRAYAD